MKVKKQWEPYALRSLSSLPLFEKQEYNSIQNTKEEGYVYVYIRFTYPFPVFPSYQQRRRSGASGALGQEKGIHLVGTGDFTHPQWREELKEKLEPEGNGLYRLKKEYQIRDAMTPDSIEPRFVVTGEISSIYKKNDKTRKVHNLLILPGLEAADRLSARLEEIGNIHSDGRPILGLDCRDLLEILLETVPEGIFVPAHIWTPHFAMFGAFSGFDTVEECFEDLTPHIHAVETGLSSDPPMNWRVSALDRFQLISNSDAHSLEN